MWSFNRISDASKITTEEIKWIGPFSLPGYETRNGLEPTPNVEGVYLFSLVYKDGLILSGIGITNSTRRRLKTHIREYGKGNYTVLDVKAAEKGIRSEIWHGWQYAKAHQGEFKKRQGVILKAIDDKLSAFKLFIAEVTDKRKRERIEAAVVQNLYVSKEPWADLIDRGMFLKERYNFEMPIETKNTAVQKIYGLPEFLEI
jgi:hypothetical protein